MKRRFLSTLMALCLALSLLPTAAFAAGGDEDAPDTGAGIATQTSTSLPEPDTNGVVTLQGDVNLGNERVEISSNVTSIDLNGHTINGRIKVVTPLTITDTSGDADGKITSDQNSTVFVEYPGNLTLNAGTIEAPKSNGCGAIYNTGSITINKGTVTGDYGIRSGAQNGGTIVKNDVSLTINGGVVHGDDYGIYTFGPGITNGDVNTVNNEQVTLTITGGKVECSAGGAAIGTNASSGAYAGYTFTMTDGEIDGNTGTGLYLPAIGINNISGGSITAAQAIRIASGVLNLTGGTIKSTANDLNDVIAGGTGNASGALVIGKAGTGYVGDLIVNVSDKAQLINETKGDNPTAIFVTDKTMNHESYKDVIIQVNIEDVNITGNVLRVSDLTNDSEKENAVGTTTTFNLSGVTISGNVVNQSTNGNVLLESSEVNGSVSTQKGGSGASVSVKDSTLGSTAGNNIIFAGTSIVGGQAQPPTGVAMVNGKIYESLTDTIGNADDGDTVTLLQSIALKAPGGLSAGQGVITIEKDIILDGNNNTITAGEGFAWNTTSNRGEYHVINIQGGADVTIRDLTIDGGKTSTSGARSGINIFTNAGETAPTVLLENVHVQNCSTYGVTVGGGSLTANDLTTSGNTWGGVNVDTKNNTNSSFTMNSGLIGEANSVYFENGSNAAVTGKINGGTFAGVVSVADQEGTTSDVTGVTLTISGGTFKNDVSAYLASGLEWDPSTGAVYTPSQGGSSSDSGPATYSPALDVSDGGSIRVSPRTPEAGDEVTITPDPDSGYEVDQVTVTDRDGDEIRVTANRDGTYTFTQPRGRVTIEVTFVRETGETTFSDVSETYWAYDEIEWAYDNGYVNGTSASTFAPGASISRQQIWMILARLSGGSPADMAAAREWAMANDISDGTNPGNAVTRQQLAALLFRFAQANGYDSGDRGDLSGFPDAGSVASYAVEALQWATASGILNGTSQGTLNPAGTATRAQFAVMLYRFWNGL